MRIGTRDHAVHPTNFGLYSTGLIVIMEQQLIVGGAYVLDVTPSVWVMQDLIVAPEALLQSGKAAIELVSGTLVLSIRNTIDRIAAEAREGLQAEKHRRHGALDVVSAIMKQAMTREAPPTRE